MRSVSIDAPRELDTLVTERLVAIKVYSHLHISLRLRTHKTYYYGLSALKSHRCDLGTFTFNACECEFYFIFPKHVM